MDAAALLDHLLDTARALREHLRAQGEALAARDLAAIERLTCEQQALLGTLREADAALLAALGLEPDATRKRVEAALAARAADLSSRWQALCACLEDCRRLNLENGRRVEGQRRVLQGVLQALRGGEGPLTYGPGEDEGTTPLRQPLGKA
ncbi:MAG: hypothetical protein KatS3mg121_1481 [Gammaproteobacteria bacterium]|nr:MAG: hypothetical protein KatS3mg121_1481 [Gammaproteobacteria bacterium]